MIPSPFTSLPNLNVSSPVVFVQLGANDGKHGACGDPIYALAQMHSWSGFAVEANPRTFLKLQKNYAYALGRVRTLNIAAAVADGFLDLYVPHRSPLTSEWASAIPSHSHGRRTKRVTVPALSIATLWKQHVEPVRVPRVDILVTDLEGYDHELLTRTNWSALAVLKPRFILFEHEHMSPGNRSVTLTHLGTHGYRTVRTVPCGRRSKSSMDTLVELAY